MGLQAIAAVDLQLAAVLVQASIEAEVVTASHRVAGRGIAVAAAATAVRVAAAAVAAAATAATAVTAVAVTAATAATAASVVRARSTRSTRNTRSGAAVAVATRSETRRSTRNATRNTRRTRSTRRTRRTRNTRSTRSRRATTHRSLQPLPRHSLCSKCPTAWLQSARRPESPRSYRRAWCVPIGNSRVCWCACIADTATSRSWPRQESKPHRCCVHLSTRTCAR